MKILLFGFGFYVLGDDNLNGGTVMPSLVRWTKISPNNSIQITCVVLNPESKKIANKRFKSFLENKNFENKISYAVQEYSEIKLHETFNCAIIAIPERSHLSCLKFLLDKTQNMIFVKPFTENLMQAEEALKLAKNNNKNIFIDFHKRFDESNLEFIKNASRESFDKGLFSFSYGQKSTMPLKYFLKWSKFSNPFQYLAPHYLHIIFLIIKKQNFDFNNFNIVGNINSFCFKENPHLVSLISSNLQISDNKSSYFINAICNWMEPKMSPFNSRQRIEFQTEGLHLISEQDNRGQLVMSDYSFKMPNPHFMTDDFYLSSGGYGIASFSNYLEFVEGRFPEKALTSINEYLPIAKVIDYVNKNLFTSKMNLS